MARGQAEGILRAAERYPGPRIIAIATYGTGGAGTPPPSNVSQADLDSANAVTYTFTNRTTEIWINADRATTAHYDRMAQISHDSGRPHFDGTPAWTGAHEYGHAIDDQAHGPSADVIRHVRYEARAKGQLPGVYVMDRLGSPYATTSPQELFSEVVADLTLNGGRAEALSREVEGIVDTAHAAVFGGGVP